MGVESAIIGSGIGSSLLGGKKSKQAGENASAALAQFWEQAQQQYLEYFDQALTALGEGEAEASDEILKGLGLSIEERTKFYDIAREEIDWVIDFGKEARGDVRHYQGESKDFLNHYKELIFNPDAIFDTEVYQSIKNRTMSEWENFYSGTGVLGGNAQAAMADRISTQAHNFLQGERSAAGQGFNLAQQGFTNALQQVGLGAQASGKAADLAFQTGDANARDYMGAYGNLANITMAMNPAQLLLQAANFMGGGTANAGTAISNLGLSGDLGKASSLGNIGNSLIYGGLTGGKGGGGLKAGDYSGAAGLGYGAPYNPGPSYYPGDNRPPHRSTPYYYGY